MHKIQNGDRFSSLTCVEVVSFDSALRWPVWLCKCDCGNTIAVPESYLQSGVKKSCGCKRETALDLCGQKFGRLTAIAPLPRRCADGSVRWLCTCECGEYVSVSSNHLLTGHTKSCGCYAMEMLKESKTYAAGTCMEIIRSAKLPDNNTSGYKGVSQTKGKWAAYITYAGKTYALGKYSNIADAVAIRKAAEKLRLEYAETWTQGTDTELFASNIYALKNSLFGSDFGVEQTPEPQGWDI